MSLDIIEAVSGMGMHLADIPPHILERQMKVMRPLLLFFNLSSPIDLTHILGILAHHSIL